MLQFYLGRKVFLKGLTVSMTNLVLRVGKVFNRGLYSLAIMSCFLAFRNSIAIAAL